MHIYERTLFRACIACYIIGTIAFIAGAIAFESDRRDITAVSWGVAGVVLLTALVLGKLHGKVSKKTVDRITQAVDNMHITPAEEANYPWLDTDTLRKWTWDLQSLGFEPLGDCTLDAGLSSPKDFGISELFVRVMASKKEKCFAEISQSHQPTDGPKSIACSIYTVFTSGDEIRTINSSSNAREQSFGIQITLHQHPGANPGDLLHHHIRQRKDLMAQQSVAIKEELTFESYEQQAKDNFSRVRNYIERQMQELLNDERMMR